MLISKTANAAPTVDEGKYRAVQTEAADLRVQVAQAQAALEAAQQAQKEAYQKGLADGKAQAPAVAAATAPAPAAAAGAGFSTDAVKDVMRKVGIVS